MKQARTCGGKEGCFANRILPGALSRNFKKLWPSVGTEQPQWIFTDTHATHFNPRPNSGLPNPAYVSCQFLLSSFRSCQICHFVRSQRDPGTPWDSEKCLWTDNNGEKIIFNFFVSRLHNLIYCTVNESGMMMPGPSLESHCPK